MIAILNADKNWGIGKRNGLLFNLPLDMNFFKQTTLGNVVCMGYNTLLSLPGGKPLKNRTNVILCEEGISVEGCICVHSLGELLTEIKKYEKDKVFITGGASVYKLMLPYCEKVLVTKVEADGEAEVFFPNLDQMENFVLQDISNPVIDNGYTIRFATYVNKTPLKF